MDNPVENNVPLPLDDATNAEEPQGESLDEIVQEPQEEPQEQPKEPGWIKQRVDKAVKRAEDRIRAEYEQKLAPLYESMMDRQAQELVDQGEFKSIERAKEYVRMKSGQPQVIQQEETDPETKARAGFLYQQAQKIQKKGVDVIGIYNSDPDVRSKILSGEWDFYDVADMVRKSPPAPTRTPNGANYNSASVKDMSDEQFRRLQDNLASGRKYNMRK